MKTKYVPSASVHGNVAPVSAGGTGGETVPEVIENLGILTLGQADIPEGVATLDENGNLRKENLPPALLGGYVPLVNGPSAMFLSSVATFVITNYDSNIEYVISTVGGTASRSVDCIYFTAGNVLGDASLTINETVFPISIVEEVIETPSFIYPVNGSVVGYQTVLELGVTSFLSTNEMAVWATTFWEFSTVEDFSTLIFSSYSSNNPTSVYAISKTEAGYVPDTVFYVRCKHFSNSGKSSEWGTCSFTMASDYLDYTAAGIGSYPEGSYTLLQDAVVDIYAIGAGGGGGGGTAIEGWSTTYGAGGSSGELVTASLSLQQGDVIRVDISGYGEGSYGFTQFEPTGVITGSDTYMLEAIRGDDGYDTHVYVNNVLALTARGGKGGDTTVSLASNTLDITNPPTAVTVRGGVAVGNGNPGENGNAGDYFDFKPALYTPEPFTFLTGKGGDSPLGHLGGTAHSMYGNRGGPGAGGAGGHAVSPRSAAAGFIGGGGHGGTGFVRIVPHYSNVVEYNNPGTFTYVMPADATVDLFGQGAGGGGTTKMSTVDGSAYVGHGGSSGSSDILSLPCLKNDVIKVVVGKGGVGGISQNYSGNITNRSQDFPSTDGEVTSIYVNDVLKLTTLGGKRANFAAPGAAVGNGSPGGTARAVEMTDGNQAWINYYSGAGGDSPLGGEGSGGQSRFFDGLLGNVLTDVGDGFNGTRGGGGGGSLYRHQLLINFHDLGGKGGDGYAKLVLHFPGTVEYDTNGTFTYIVPPGIVSADLTAQAAGGGGANALGAGGGGGGSSGSSADLSLPVVAGDVVKVVVGNGGLRGGVNNDGEYTYTKPGNGGVTSIYVNDVLKLTTLGGLGAGSDRYDLSGGIAVGNGNPGGNGFIDVNGGAAGYAGDGGDSPTGGLGGTFAHKNGTKGGGGAGGNTLTSPAGFGGDGYAKLVFKAIDLVEYNLSGTFTYTVPANFDTVEITGQSAGGGGDSLQNGGGGGGASGSSSVLTLPVVPGDIVKTVIGAGGTGGGWVDLGDANASYHGGTPGGSTQIYVNNVLKLTVLGGARAGSDGYDSSGGQKALGTNANSGTNGGGADNPAGKGGDSPTGGLGGAPSAALTIGNPGTKGGGGGGNAGVNHTGGRGGDGYAKLKFKQAINLSYLGKPGIGFYPHNTWLNGGQPYNTTYFNTVTYTVTGNCSAVITSRAGGDWNNATTTTTVNLVVGDIVTCKVGFAGGSDGYDIITGEPTNSDHYQGGWTEVLVNGVRAIYSPALVTITNIPSLTTPGKVTLKLIPA